jgi:hypothetical protein
LRGNAADWYTVDMTWLKIWTQLNNFKNSPFKNGLHQAMQGIKSSSKSGWAFAIVTTCSEIWPLLWFSYESTCCRFDRTSRNCNCICF